MLKDSIVIFSRGYSYDIEEKLSSTPSTSVDVLEAIISLCTSYDAYFSFILLWIVVHEKSEIQGQHFD